MTLALPFIDLSHSMTRLHDTALQGFMGSMSEIVEEVAVGDEEMIYVLVGKDVKESESTLKWALRNFDGKKLCILHVHQPAKKIPIMGTKFSISRLEDHQVRTYHNTERLHMHNLLETYKLICERARAPAEKLHIEMDSIEKGIVELITMHNIKKLVMGAAADKLYSKKMVEPKSKKAIYVCWKAPVSCHIWYVCKGNLVYTRRGDINKDDSEVLSPPLPPTSNILLQSSSLRPDANGGLTPSSSVSTERNSDAWDFISRRSASVSLCEHSSSEMVADLSLISFARPEGSQNRSEFQEIPHSEVGLCNLSPLSAQEEILFSKLYDEFEKTMVEVDSFRQNAIEESMRRKEAEKLAIEAMRRAKSSESSYAEELRRKQEIEEALASGKEEIEKLKPELHEVKKELQLALEQKSSLELKIKNSDKMMEDLEEKIYKAVELLQSYKKEKDELLVERENALGLAKELRKKYAEYTSIEHMTTFCDQISLKEIEEATHNFDLSLKIGEGGYGSIYRGVLRHTQVAIKVLHSDSSQGPSEFQREVNVLSKLRHPNLITLIGACPEACILVYEYLPNGSLEDRLSCKDNTPPLSWQTRVRIAAELCSVLVFLHSCKPRSIIHGDLKPANILLDANHVSKLSDFGICCLISQDEMSSNNTACCRTDYPKGTFSYIDPEYLSTGELTRKSDAYSFGIILLRLLTGRPAVGIAKDVQSAFDNGNMKDLLDATAGDWPFVRAKQLALLALSCCEMSHNRRPDLISEVWRMFEPMRVSCGASSSRFASEDHGQIPQFYFCPIFQEIMQDPVVAADGYTYEAEAIKGWLESGNDKSPMTDQNLANDVLVPNHVLRSAIQEWLQQP
ncbi:hypothetical protein AgCh_019144 [Apium graveolens]